MEFHRASNPPDSMFGQSMEVKLSQRILVAIDRQGTSKLRVRLNRVTRIRQDKGRFNQFEIQRPQPRIFDHTVDVDRGLAIRRQRSAIRIFVVMNNWPEYRTSISRVRKIRWPGRSRSLSAH